MREIKFRAWDKKQKRWANLQLSEMEFTRDGLLRVGETIEYGTHAEFNDFELMQFTGLLDKSGVEIYEGDVVKFEDDFTEIVDPELGGPTYTEYQLATVAFDCGGFGIVVRNSSDYLNEGFVTFDYVNRYIGDTPIEVIGNIHENPELLEGK